MRREWRNTMNYCPYCGEQVGEGFAFCPRCGRQLSLVDNEMHEHESAEDVREKSRARDEEKELAQIAKYQMLYDSTKNKCVACGGQPDADCAQMISLSGKEGTMEVWVPVCRDCDLAWKRKRAMVDQEVAVVDREIEAAKIVYAKKKKMMDFICFGYDRVLRNAYEPIKELLHKKSIIEKGYPSDSCLYNFPLIVMLVEHGYTLGNPDMLVRGRGPFDHLRPEVVIEFR